MRPDLKWGIAAAAALAIGGTCAAGYARLAAPYYQFVAERLAAGHPWEIVGVAVKPGKSRLTEELQLDGYVRRRMDSTDHAARVVGRVQVGEVVETPIVFWTLLLVWPAATRRQRAARLIIGVPVFLGLEAITTATQVMLPLAQASAILAGDAEPVTAWDRWSRFLEFGGQFVLDCAAAMILAALLQQHPRGSSLPQI